MTRIFMDNIYYKTEIQKCTHTNYVNHLKIYILNILTKETQEAVPKLILAGMEAQLRLQSPSFSISLYCHE